ncbi:hypothetical protein CLU79DRAFT_297729 [Phycomyces nitens]|nr:hypothetical protein CLU79DRAFT_297729 [Phycomyces nitens]
MSTPIQEAHHLVNAKITQYFEKSAIPIKEPRKRTDENTIDETEHVRQKPRDKRLGGQLRSPLKDIGPNIGVPLRPPSGRPIPTGSQIKVWRDEPSTSASVRKDKQTIGSNSLSLGSNLAQNKSSQFQKRTLGSLSPAPLKQLSKPSNKLSAKHTTDSHKYKITSIDQASITDLKRNRQAPTHQPTSICKSQGLSRTTKPYSTLSKNTPCTSTPLADKNTCSDPMFSILCTDQLSMASSTSDPLLFHTDSAPDSESTFLQDNDNEDSPQERCPNKSNLRDSNENTFFSTDALNSQKQHYSPPVDAISDQSDVCKNNN